MICPICEKDSKMFLKHLKTSKDEKHLLFFQQQTNLVIELFHNLEFDKTVDLIDFGLYFNYDNCLKIWRDKFTDSERNERSLKLNAYKVSKALKGIPKSEEHKEALSKSHLGQEAWNKGLTVEDPRVRAIQDKRNETMSGVLKDMYSDGKLVPWYKGMSKETSEKLRKMYEKSSKTMAGKQRPTKRSISGIRKDIGHHATSTYEANIYRILQLTNCKYLHEFEIIRPITMPDGSTKYYRLDIQDLDGCLGVKNAYLEIKGFYSKEDRLKVEMFRKQYPDEKLLLVGYGDKRNEHFWQPDVDMRDLENQYRSLIPLWEDRKQNLRKNPELYTEVAENENSI